VVTALLGRLLEDSRVEAPANLTATQRHSSPTVPMIVPFS
jgi:hypothetical protein